MRGAVLRRPGAATTAGGGHRLRREAGSAADVLAQGLAALTAPVRNLPATPRHEAIPARASGHSTRIAPTGILSARHRRTAGAQVCALTPKTRLPRNQLFHGAGTPQWHVGSTRAIEQVDRSMHRARPPRLRMAPAAHRALRGIDIEPNCGDDHLFTHGPAPPVFIGKGPDLAVSKRIPLHRVRRGDHLCRSGGPVSCSSPYSQDRWRILPGHQCPVVVLQSSLEK